MTHDITDQNATLSHKKGIPINYTVLSKFWTNQWVFLLEFGELVYWMKGKYFREPELFCIYSQ